MEGNKYKRISKVAAIFMISVAAMFDLLEVLVDWIPVAGQVLSFIIDVISLTTFSLWFLIKGADLGSPKAASKFWLVELAELLPIPVIDFFLCTLGVSLMIGQTWKEDSGVGQDNHQATQIAKVISRK